MLAVLYGNDRLFKEIRVLRESEKNNRKIKFINSDKKKEIEEFLPTLFLNNMFGESYTVYFRNFESLKKSQFKTALEKLKYFDENDAHSIFIDVDSKLKKEALKQEKFELPKPWKKEEWELKVRQISSLYDIRLNKRQIDRLLEISDNNLFFIRNEIEKLSVVAENYVVKDDIFDSLIFSHSQDNIDEFVFEFLKGNYPEALKIFSSINKNITTLQILYRLYRNSITLYELLKKIPIRNRYTFDDMKNHSKTTGYNIPTLSKFTGFAFKPSEKGENILLKYSVQQAESLIINLWNIDYGIKNGIVNSENAVISLLKNWKV